MPECPNKDSCHYVDSKCWHCHTETGNPADTDWYESKPSYDENDANPLKMALHDAPGSAMSAGVGQYYPLQQLMDNSKDEIYGCNKELVVCIEVQIEYNKLARKLLYLLE